MGDPIPAVTPLSQPRPAWCPPSCGCLKINCDASVAANSGRTSIAAVLRDWQGRLDDGVVFLSQSSSVFQGEACAVRLACRLLQALGLSNVQAESDCKVVIDLSVLELDPPWDCLALLHDIQALGVFFPGFLERPIGWPIGWLLLTSGGRFPWIG
ncbi:hypothetical protein ACSBR1_002663 [Camellia fascicularis]